MVSSLKTLALGILSLFQQQATLNSYCYTTLNDYWHKTADEQEEQKQQALSKNARLSQTSAHLLFGITNAGKQSITTLLERYRNERNASIDPLAALTPALTKEHEANTHHFRVLYTSEQPQFYAAHYIDTCCKALYQECIKNNPISCEHFLILRQPCPEQPFDDFDAQAQKRLQYLTNGVNYGGDNHSYHQRYLLSCNAAILGNIENWAECSFRYMLQKHRARSGDAVTIQLEALFAQYAELETFFTEHMHELEQAIDQFVANAPSGILLQLIFKSDDLLKSCCYSSGPGGSLESVSIQYEFGQGYELIENPVIILDTYCREPYLFHSLDTVQLRLILTSDLLLDITNPEITANVEMYPYCLNPEVLNCFHEKVKTVCYA